MSMIDSEAQDFTVRAYQDYEFRPVTKEDLKGKWSVFFFYPAVFTFVCPTELQDLQNHYEAFKKISCEIYSISCDSVYVHKAWHDHSQAIGKVEFPMIGDPGQVLTRAFDVLAKNGEESQRATFIIDPKCQVVGYEIISSNVGRDAEELLRKVEACQFVYEHGDMMCPAAWHPGDTPLVPGNDLISDIKKKNKEIKKEL